MPRNYKYKTEEQIQTEKEKKLKKADVILRNKDKKKMLLSKPDKQQLYSYITSLFRKGWSTNKISEYLQAEYNVKPQAVSSWINQTYNYMNTHNENFVKNLRRVQLERLEYMLEKTIEKEDWRTATQIAEVINKTFALYEIKTEVKIVDDTIKFKFGDDVTYTTTDYQVIDTELTEDENNIMETAMTDE